MKIKVVLVLLAALFLVPAAVANSIRATSLGSIDYDTGTFQSGTLSGSFSNMINVNVMGSLHTIDIQTGMLVKTMTGCPTGSTCYDFTGGSVAVDGTLFKDSINGGITIRGNGTASISATLMPEAGVSSGSVSASFDFAGAKLTSGSEDVAFNTLATPEPGTLLLFGTGLLGLAITKLRKWQMN